MFTPDLFVNRIVVLASAVVYWVGVYLQTRRIRHRIGRSPNVKPRGPKEKLLWAGWVLVVLAWLTLPFLAGSGGAWFGWQCVPALCGPASRVLGIGLIGAGYAGTLWCYAAMGAAWRIGVNRAETTTLVTQGPFQFVRHPIYLCQIVMLIGVALLLPTPISLAILVIHILFCGIKASDEENHLRNALGGQYRDYLSRTGRFFPKLRIRSK
jgi:protein-S-isoprenylcysteine O-methyltransferase Ste14